MLLTLVLSLQAAYAAPLILLAQNRQERRDRVAAEQDRDVAERTQADTEFLAREIASVRYSLADVVTGEELRDELSGMAEAIELLNARLDDVLAQAHRSDSRRASCCGDAGELLQPDAVATGSAPARRASARRRLAGDDQPGCEQTARARAW